PYFDAASNSVAISARNFRQLKPILAEFSSQPVKLWKGWLLSCYIGKAPVAVKVKPSESISHDYARARERMVQEQIIGRGISDARVIAAMRKMSRHLFVDPSLVNRAYDDSALPIG